MGLRRGALTFTQAPRDGEAATRPPQKYFDAVKLRSFQPLKPEDEASEAVGWCVMERPFDLDFELDKIFYDRFVLLGFRVDKWRIPSSLLKAQVHDEEQRMLSRAGREKLTRESAKRSSCGCSGACAARSRRFRAPSTRSGTSTPGSACSSRTRSGVVTEFTRPVREDLRLRAGRR